MSRENRVAAPELESGVPERGPTGAEEEEPTGRRVDADLGEAGRDDDTVELQAELLEKRGYGDELRKLLRRLAG